MSALRFCLHRFSLMSILGLAIVALFAQPARAALVEIETANDFSLTGLGSGDYAPIGGTNITSAPGQITQILEWTNAGSADMQMTGSDLDTLAEFLTFYYDVNPGAEGGAVNTIVLGLGAAESDANNSVDMTELTIMIDGATVTSFGVDDILRVTAYGSGQADAEAFIQVNFGMDIASIPTPELVSFKLSSTVVDRTNGAERLFVTDLVAIPEPSAFAFGGLVCGVIGLGAAWRRGFGKPQAPAAAA